MTKAVQSILEQAMALPDNEHAELVDILAGTLEPTSESAYVVTWDAEIKRRLKAMEAGTEQRIPWREAMEQIRHGTGAGEDV